MERTEPHRISHLAAVAAVWAASLAPAPSSAEDWPRWRGPRGDGTWHGPPLPEVWPADGLAAAWRAPVGGGYSGIAVADGRVYTMDRQDPWQLAAGPAAAERVLAFSADDGAALWEFAYAADYGKVDYGTGPRATPTVHDGRVYTLGAVGHVHCLDAATGDVLWSRDLAAQGAKVPEWGLAASPLVWRDLVVLHAGVEPGGCFIALDRRTGVEVWRAGDDPAGYCTPIVIHTGDDQRLVGWTPRNVVGLAPATGDVLWQVPYEVTYGVSIATPVYHRGLVVVSGYWEGTKAIRLGPSPTEATLAWEDNRYLRGLMSQPLCRGEYAYLLDKSHGLTCFRIDTGEKLWDDGHQLTPRDRNPQANLVWLGDSDRTLALNSEGELVLARLTPEGYQEQSRTSVIGPTWAHFALSGTRLYARDDRELVCVPLVPSAP